MSLLHYAAGLGSKLPVSSVSEQEVRSYREFERREMQKSLDEYLLICQSMRVLSFSFSSITHVLFNLMVF